MPTPKEQVIDYLKKKPGKMPNQHQLARRLT